MSVEICFIKVSVKRLQKKERDGRSHDVYEVSFPPAHAAEGRPRANDYEVSAELMEYLSPAKTPQGTLALCCLLPTAPPEKLYTFTVTEEILKELGDNVDASLYRYVDREIHSLKVLKAML